ncbi:hypothetical protein Tco_1157033 [Tanacetum coccineum]
MPFKSHHIDNEPAFSSPPTPDTLVEFVHELGIQRKSCTFDYAEGGGRINSIHPQTFTKTKEIGTTYSGEEETLVILKFSAREAKREVFGMTILMISSKDVIRSRADYYDLILKKLAQHQRYIAGEELSDPESPAPKPAKLTKQAKPKATELSTVKSKTKASKPAPAKPKEKKRKPVSEPSETQHLPKRAKAGKVTKKRTIKSSKKLIDEFH